MTSTKNINVERLLIGQREAAAMLSVSGRTLWGKTKAGIIPHKKIGSRVLYSPDELRQWVASGCPSSDSPTR